MNQSISIFQELSIVITSNSLYNKSIDTYDSIAPVDESVFTQLQSLLSNLTIKDDTLFSFEIDYLTPLLFFLLEHIPLEIDLNLLTSTQTDYHEQLTSTSKIYKPNIFSTNKH